MKDDLSNYKARLSKPAAATFHGKHRLVVLQTPGSVTVSPPMCHFFPCSFSSLNK